MSFHKSRRMLHTYDTIMQKAIRKFYTDTLSFQDAAQESRTYVCNNESKICESNYSKHLKRIKNKFGTELDIDIKQLNSRKENVSTMLPFKKKKKL